MALCEPDDFFGQLESVRKVLLFGPTSECTRSRMRGCSFSLDKLQLSLLRAAILRTRFTML